MVVHGFYKITQEFVDLIKNLGGKYEDNKERPIFCCFEDKYTPDLYWAIPTSKYDHRDVKEIERIKKFCAFPERDIKWAYYFIGYTNCPAIYKISNCFPITYKYIDSIYTSKSQHLILQDKTDIAIIKKKLSRILFDESKHPDKYEQKITSIKNYLITELAK